MYAIYALGCSILNVFGYLIDGLHLTVSKQQKNPQLENTTYKEILTTATEGSLKSLAFTVMGIAIVILGLFAPKRVYHALTPPIWGQFDEPSDHLNNGSNITYSSSDDDDDHDLNHCMGSNKSKSKETTPQGSDAARSIGSSAVLPANGGINEGSNAEFPDSIGASVFLSPAFTDFARALPYESDDSSDPDTEAPLSSSSSSSVTSTLLAVPAFPTSSSSSSTTSSTTNLETDLGRSIHSAESVSSSAVTQSVLPASSSSTSTVTNALPTVLVFPTSSSSSSATSSTTNLQTDLDRSIKSAESVSSSTVTQSVLPASSSSTSSVTNALPTVLVFPTSSSSSSGTSSTANSRHLSSTSTINETVVPSSSSSSMRIPTEQNGIPLPSDPESANTLRMDISFIAINPLVLREEESEKELDGIALVEEAVKDYTSNGVIDSKSLFHQVKRDNNIPLSIDGIRHSTPESIQQALLEKGFNEQFALKILCLMHQGVFAPLQLEIILWLREKDPNAQLGQGVNRRIPGIPESSFERHVNLEILQNYCLRIVATNDFHVYSTRENGDLDPNAIIKGKLEIEVSESNVVASAKWKVVLPKERACESELLSDDD